MLLQGRASGRVIAARAPPGRSRPACVVVRATASPPGQQSKGQAAAAAGASSSTTSSSSPDSSSSGASSATITVKAPQRPSASDYIAGPFGSGRLSIDQPADAYEDVLEIPTLRHMLQPRDSPFALNNNSGGGFVGDRDKIRLHTVEFESPESSGATCANGENNTFDEDTCLVLPEWAIRSGPRRTIYFDPEKVTAAIVTCGGLCPGLNDVVQNLVYTLSDYGVPEDQILGIRFGLRGFYEREDKPITLTRRMVDGIHLKGGTMLGTSRGGANIREIVRRIDLWGLDMVFVVGGNGGNAAADAIQREVEAQGVRCAVAGVPKSIDNDILLIDKCFGFDTAVEEAQRALLAAKVEASSARRGIGLVKLMGRQSGFIAMQASMASGVVDAVLIPEVPFTLTGERGLYRYLEGVLAAKGHAVVCVAEGAGQDLLDGELNNSSNGSGGAAGGAHGTDASGNPILKDIGMYLRSGFKGAFPDADVKYIDPSYIIRSIPTTSNDRIYCKILAHNAVHAAFAGYTGITVGLVNTHYVYLPIPVIIQAPRKVDPRGRAWNRLRASIGQPNFY